MDTSFCFINSHLPARKDRILNRNQDYSSLVEGLEFGKKKSDVINQFHHVFWMGDLNYRVDASRESILHNIQYGNWGAMLRNDQLIHEMNAFRTFYKFKEGRIHFRPSYRWERGSDEISKKVTTFFFPSILLVNTIFFFKRKSTMFLLTVTEFCGDLYQVMNPTSDI